MNTALDNFISSIPVEVNASKYHNQSIPLDTHRFTCPACGEYVGLVINGFFRHGKRTDESDFCEKRVDSTGSSCSLQYRVGVPIYIRRNNMRNDYELKIGFPSISYDILKIAADAEVTIADKSNIEKATYTAKYSISRLSPSETTLCELDFIPANDRSYSLYLSKYGYYLDKYLSNYADGFINNNALFTYHSGEGRKIHKGDTIEANTDYILVPSNYINENGVFLEKIGKLKLRYMNSYTVYRVHFSDSNEVIFKKLVAFCHENFRVTLVRKKPELLPLWPPTIQKNNRYEVINGHTVYAAVLPANAEPKIYKHSDMSFTEYEVTKTDHLNYVKIDCSYNCVVTVSKVYSLDSFYFKKSVFEDNIKRIGHEPIFEGANVEAETIQVDADTANMACYINKGYILTGFYKDRTVDIKHNKAELKGLSSILVSRCYDDKRFPIRKYILERQITVADITFDFHDDPLNGSIVPITPAAVVFLKQHYNEISNKEYFRRIIMTGKISLAELKRIYAIIDGVEKGEGL